MRLLFLSNFYPPHHLGGYEELCAEVAGGLRARGHRVAVLTSGHGAQGCEREPDVYRVLRPEVSLRPYHATLDFFVGRKRRERENLRRFAKVLDDFDPDVLMVWGMWNLSRRLPFAAESRARPPVVYYIADYWPALPGAYTLHWQAPARRAYARVPKQALGAVARQILARENHLASLKFEHVLCVSQAVRHALQTAGVVGEEAQVVYNGIDVERFAGTRRTVAETNGPFAVLYAGRLAPEKGVHMAIEALGIARREGSPIELTIAGAGSRAYEARLRRLCEQWVVSEHVTFAGRVPREEMPQLMARFDALLVPSEWPEPLPRVVQEGMAAGLVVLASGVGGIGEIVQNESNGLTFQAGNAAELAVQLSRACGDADLRARLSTAAQATVRAQFDIRRTVGEIEAYLGALSN